MVGDDAAGRRAADLIAELGVDPSGLLVVPGRPTTRKTRVIARSQQVVRFDRETLEPPPAAVGTRLLAAIDRQLGACAGVVLEDYGKGVLSKSVAARRDAAFPQRGACPWSSTRRRASPPTAERR